MSIKPIGLSIPLDDPRITAFESFLGSNPALADALWPEWSPYIPHEPTGKQLAFLSLPHREAFYGGAAGGGKSDAVLMAALQYVHIPQYSAIIFRKTFADLSLPGALIERSRLWLKDTDAKWNSQQHQWVFPSGATLAFGYMQDELDKYRYQSTEFQFIGFDEVTQFWKEDYLYMFSRLRTKRCPDHYATGADPNCATCAEYDALSRIPCRMRAASNPGGIGHFWVKQRFDIGRVGDHYLGRNPKRPYIPAFLTDNPYLDQAGYEDSLSNLDPVTREQLLRGDWGVSPNGRFRRHWVKYYYTEGDYVVCGNKRYHVNSCRCFQTVDPAASAKEGPGDEQVWKRAPSWTVISTWLVTPDGHLIWWDLKRFREEVPDVVDKIVAAYKEHRAIRNVEFTGIEASGLGIGVFQTAQRMGVPVRALMPKSMDKLVRATDAANKMKQGMVWLPQRSPWLEDLEGELFTWTAHPHEPADQIDTLSYAAMILSDELGYFAKVTRDALPTAY